MCCIEKAFNATLWLYGINNSIWVLAKQKHCWRDDDTKRARMCGISILQRVKKKKMNKTVRTYSNIHLHIFTLSIRTYEMLFVRRNENMKKHNFLLHSWIITFRWRCCCGCRCHCCRRHCCCCSWCEWLAFSYLPWLLRFPHRHLLFRFLAPSLPHTHSTHTHPRCCCCRSVARFVLSCWETGNNTKQKPQL